MIQFHQVMSKWHYIILSVALIHFIVIHMPYNGIENDDASSAIRRAKTESCKTELQEFASRILTDHISNLQLKRQCRLDQNKIRNQKVGCVTNSTSGLVKLDDKVVNSSVCLDYCFSFGHSHGGFSESSGDCFCGNDLVSAIEGLTNDCRGHDEVEWYKVNNGIFYPAKIVTNPRSIESNDTKQVRIAFLLILNGRSDLHIRRLLKSIYRENHIYYLHIDKRNYYLFNKLASLPEEYGNVIVTKSRFNTIWGGPSLLRMIIDAIENLSHFDWDYLINISESDLPIKPLDDIESYLSENTSSIFLRTHNIKGYNFIKKQGLDRNFYQCENRVWRMGKRQLPRGIIYSGGSDWFALPRDFCIYVIRDLSNREGLVKPLMQIYNHTLLPAESFFHTLALNSDFCDRFTDTNLRLTNWNRKRGCKCQHKDTVDWCGCSPLVYRWSDWDKLNRTTGSNDLMFSRKFDPTISSSIIAAVEHKLMKRMSSDIESEYDTRFWQNIFTLDESIDQPDESYEVMLQFGLFSLNQVRLDLPQLIYTQIKLKSIDTFFNKDRFVGWIFDYCSMDVCLKFLVERIDNANLHDHRSQCFKSVEERSLKVIEVNHGFDTGERMFRVYKPLYHLSDIVVYHEWIVSNTSKSRGNSTDQVRFEWLNPKAQLELAQNVKLKRVAKPTKLTLAHRLTVQKPLLPGSWTLKISHRNIHCLSYKFLVFDNTAFEKQSISQLEFNKFFNVTKKCITPLSNMHSDSNLNMCSKQDWTLH